MPTQDERLSTVEQNMTILNRAIYDISHNESLLLGLVMEQERDLREMKSSIAALNERMNSRFETQQRIIESFEQSVNSRFEEQGNQLKEQGNQLKEHGNKLDQILLVLSTLAPKLGQGA